MKNKTDERIDDFTDEDVVEDVVPQTEIPKQRDFFKIPRRFGSIPIDELPLGCDPEKQYQKECSYCYCPYAQFVQKSCNVIVNDKLSYRVFFSFFN